MICKRAVIAAFLVISAIGVTHADQEKSSGTGFAVTADGWLITNAHVVDRCDRVEVKGLGVVADARTDATNDLALLKVAPKAPLKPLVFRLAPIRLGEDIVALGYPLAGLLSDSLKITTGNVNALAGMRNDTRYIQISTPIQPGNSGGPVLDKDGLLMGITSATLSKEVADQIGITAQNVNFAIRASVAELFMQSQGVPVLSGDRAPNEPVRSTADLAEEIAPSVYYVLCFGQPEAQEEEASEKAASVSAATVPAKATLLEASGYDAIGFDYTSLAKVSYAACKTACENDGRCKALTYNTKYRFCFLKSDVVALIRNSDAMAGYTSTKSAEVIVSDFTSYSDIDLPGGDYKRIRQTDYIQCFLSCIEDNSCRAFSYGRRKHECWLKNQLGKPRPIKGVELGVK